MTALLKIFDVVPSWVYAIVIAALLVTTGVQQVRVANGKSNLAEEKAAFQKYQTEMQTNKANAEIAKAKHERELQTQIDNERKRNAKELADLTATNTTLLNSLRSRPTRPTMPNPGIIQFAGDGQVAAGCTGDKLYADDSELLVREALRADKTRLALVTCYADYDAAKIKLRGSK